VSLVVVIGATGNVGTSLLAALAPDNSVEEIVGVARRRPALQQPKTTWCSATIETHDFARRLARVPCGSRPR
jgi:UDP-glucose 4-epimerase